MVYIHSTSSKSGSSSSSSARYVTTSSSSSHRYPGTISTIHHGRPTIISSGPIITGGSSILGGSFGSLSSSGMSTSKKTVTTSHGYGPATTTTTVTTNRSPGSSLSHATWHHPHITGGTTTTLGGLSTLGGTSLISGPAWINSTGFPSSSQLLTHGGMTTTTKVQRYEWHTGADGVMRQYLVEDSENTTPSNAGSSSTTTMLTGGGSTSMTGGAINTTSATHTSHADHGASINQGTSIWQPTIKISPIEQEPERKLSISSDSSLETTTTNAKSESAMEEQAQVTRLARMRAAAEKMMMMSKLKKAEDEKNQILKQEEEKKRALESEISQLQQHNSNQATSLEMKLEMMMREVEQLKIQQKSDETSLRKQIEMELEEKRRIEEQERRQQMEMEMERLKAMEAEKTRMLEEQLRQLQDQTQAQQMRFEKEQELLEIKEQQQLLHQTIKVEEQASQLASTININMAEQFVAIDHPFKSIMLKVHSLSTLSPEVLQLIGDGNCLVRFALGSHRLEVESNRRGHDNTFEWDDLLSFPYMNEKYLKITAESSINAGSILGGVKIDMEDFLLNPNEMCGQHDIPIVTPNGQPAGTITLTIQLSLELVTKSFVAVRPKPISSSSSHLHGSSSSSSWSSTIHQSANNTSMTPAIAMSSLVTPYRSLKVDIHSMKDAKELFQSIATFVCRVSLGHTSLTSPRVTNNQGSQWNMNFGLPFSSEKFIKFEILTEANQLIGSSQLDLDTLLMSGNSTHAVNVALKQEAVIIGYLPVAFEFATEMIAPYVKESSSWSTSSQTQSFGQHGTSTNQLMSSMMQMLDGHTSILPQLTTSALAPPTSTTTTTTTSMIPQHHFGSILTDTGLGWGLLPMTAGSMLSRVPGTMVEQQTEMIPRPTNCKVQIHHVRDLKHESKASGFVPLVKVTVLGNQAQTAEPKITGAASAQWKTAKGCFNFEMDVNKILESVKVNPDMGNLILEVYDSSSSEHLLIGTAQVSLLPIITVSTGYFCGDVQLTKNSDGRRYGLANLTITTF